MDNINHYITQFCRGSLKNIDAYLILKCSFKYFYENCTNKQFKDLDMFSDEYIEYLNAHMTIQCDPLTRSTLEELSKRYEKQLQHEHEEYHLDEQYEIHNFTLSQDIYRTSY